MQLGAWSGKKTRKCNVEKTTGKKISIIIPIYNMEVYLQDCLDSVVGQSLKDIEIICVDDGSNDNSYAILEKYAQEYPIIRILRQNNQGSGKARNQGIRIAKGEYIAFMDPDDYYPTYTTLEEMYEVAKREKVLICGGSVIEKKNDRILSREEIGRPGFFFEKDGYVAYEDYQVSYGYWRFLYQTDFLRDNKLFFPDYRRFQDPPFFVETMIAAKGFYALTKPTYVWRQVEKQIPYWEECIINNMMRGAIDILQMSKENNLEHLHAERIPMICEELIRYIYNAVYDGNNELDELLIEYCKCIDADLLQKDGRYMDIPKLKVGAELKEYVKRIRDKEIRLWNEINAVNGVIIYGAGVAGQTLCKYLLKSGYSGDLSFAVTQNALQDSVLGKDICCIKDVIADRKDYQVIVALKGEERFQMVDFAKKCGFIHVEELELEEIRMLYSKQPYVRFEKDEK